MAVKVIQSSLPMLLFARNVVVSCVCERAGMENFTDVEISRRADIRGMCVEDEARLTQ